MAEESKLVNLTNHGHETEEKKKTIDNFSDLEDNPDIRGKALIRWLNWRLGLSVGPARITDLCYDLRNGVILLQLLSYLTDTQIPIEHGDFRVQKLGNLSSVLGIMQRERARTDGLDVTRILEGNLEQTLDLVWNIIIRWELQPRFSKPEWESFSIDQVLLCWLNSLHLDSTVNLRPNSAVDLRHLLQDGEVLCRLVLCSHPNLTGLEDALDKDALHRWSVLLRCAKKYLDTPDLLDAEDLASGTIDKNSILCYLGILFSALPHPQLTPNLIERFSSSTSSSSDVSAKISGSPVKTQSRSVENVLTVGEWMNCLEEVLGWILEAEEHLLSLHNLGHRNLHTVKTKFYNHEDFMLELQTHQSSVGKVLGRGKELVNLVSNPQDQIEIRVQMKVLIERWEKVRELAMSKQADLHKLVMSLQLEQISELRTWMTEAEDRISRLGRTGDSPAEVEQQLTQIEELQRDLESQHAAVSAISNFILVESEDTSNIEDELSGLGERWCMICRCIEERLELLQKVRDLLQEQERLNSYLQGVETMLKEMEMSQEVESQQLQEQNRKILAVESELEIEREQLSQLGVDTEYIQNGSLEKDPGVEKLCQRMETLQDRWDVLIEILFAQKHRISKLGVELSRPNLHGEHQGGTAKKRKVTGSRRIEFETCHARILSWCDSLLSRLQEPVILTLPLQDQTLLLEDTQAEVLAQREKVAELTALGDSLRRDIESEENFPPDYLSNVTSKVQGVTLHLAHIDTSLARLKDQIDLKVEKDCFYQLVGELNKIFDKFQTFSVEAKTQLERSRVDKDLRAKAREKRLVLDSVSIKLEQIQSIGANLALHSVSDPGNTVKRDLYQLCQTFQTVDAQFSALLARLQSSPGPETPVEEETSEGTSEDLTTSGQDCTVAHRISGDRPDPSENGLQQNNPKNGCVETSVIAESSPIVLTPTCDTRSGSSGEEVGGEEVGGEEVGGDKGCSRQISEFSLQVGGVEHYEECTVSSTLKIKQPTVEKAEIFITMKTLSRIESSEPKVGREVSELERNLSKCDNYLRTPLFLEDSSSMDDEISHVHSHLKLLGDAFVPASMTEEESSRVLDQLLRVKQDLRTREKETKDLLENLNQFREEVSGLSLWMKEVRIFLDAEDAALGDIETLEAQLKESNALQTDIRTLEPNLENVREMGNNLLNRSNPESGFYTELKAELGEVCHSWDATVLAAGTQNTKLKVACEKSREVLDLMSEINNFLDQLEQELPRGGVVTEAPELSQRTFKLLQLRDRTDRKSCVLERLSTTLSELLESGEAEVAAAETSKVSSLEAKFSEVQHRWSSLTRPVKQLYSRMREATTDYGEFKTLVAQESDWLDRLEKKLRRSSKCAADAEEISEELDDLENCLHNHPADRLQRLKLLAASLSEKDVLISPVQTETGRLEKRWQTLERQAKERIRSLEECITEAQEWECKILAVQDWLAEKDILLSSHLEHELTVDDLPDETQRMLREFEDKENVLAEMDEQVDIYRDAGKEEAAARLEDQLMLIHTKFQELSSKFEMFQQPADYDGRLGRISRQLRDIQHNMYLTELISHEPDSIHGQLHHTRCIYNALADIKPEVEATIKMGRKLVETGSVAHPTQTSRNIDSLKELFNILGAQVTEAREMLQKALEISEVLMLKLNLINRWLAQAEREAETINSNEVPDRVKEMKEMKKDVREILAMKQEFVSLCSDPSLLVGLKEALSGLESKWSSVKMLLTKRLPEGEKAGVLELDLSGEDGYRFTSPANNSLNSSIGEEGMVLQEFRVAFQEISAWLDKAEQQLERIRRASSEDRQLGEQILNLQPKVESLGEMAVKIVEQFASQRPDVEPEMEILGQRWENILAKIEKSSNFSVVEVEQIRTTIAHLVIPAADPLATSMSSEPEEISTLPEDNTEDQSRLNINGKDSSRDSSPEYFSASPRSPEKKVYAKKEIIMNGSPTKFSQKTPPPTKPKPRWYVESLQEPPSATSTSSVISSVPPVQQVTITSTTLPSPRSLASSGNTVIPTQRKTTPVPIVSPVRTILPSLDTSPSTSPVNSPSIRAPQSVLDDIDRQNERDNAIIDRLLRGTSADIEDVKARKAYTSTRFQSSRDSAASHAKDIKEFEEKFTNISLRIATARRRFQELDQETDCALRNDLIDMELQELEAEVATTISRGDTLVLMVHRFDSVQGDDLKNRVTQLRESWGRLRTAAEEKKTQSLREFENMEVLKSKLEKMQSWLGSVVKAVKQKTNEDDKVTAARREIEKKSTEMRSIEKLASSLKTIDRLGDMKETLIYVRSNWGVLKDLGTPLRKSKSKSPRETVDKSVPAEIFARITKMQEALAAVRSQLDTSIMTGKTYDNLSLQADTLNKVKQALDTLRPKVKKTISDIDVVSGALSMEYFDKLTALGERLQRDWKGINEDCAEREKTWRECEAELQRFNAQADSLSAWLTAREKTVILWKQKVENYQPVDYLTSLETEIKEKEKAVQLISDLGHKISNESGATEARDIFSKYDNLRKRWRYVYTETCLQKNDINSNGDAKPGSGKDGGGAENGNLNDIVNWAESALHQAGQVFNLSQLEELREGIQLLQGLQVNLINQKVSLDELAAQVGENSSVYQTSRFRLEKVATFLPKRLSHLTEKCDKLVRMVEQVEENHKWIETIQVKFTSSTTSEESITVRMALSDKEYSISKLFSDFLLLEREVSFSGQPVNTNLAKEVKDLKDKWLKLSGDVRRITPVVTSTQITPTQITPTTAEIPKTNSSHSVSSFVSLVSLASPTSSDQWAASPTTASASPMSEDVETVPSTDTLVSFSEKCQVFSGWIADLSNEMGNGKVGVADTDGVGRELDRYRAIISQLEARKTSKEELVRAGLEFKSDQAKSLCDEIQRMWSSLHQSLMARKTELTAMLEHSDNLNAKGKEVSQWLNKLEKMLAGEGVGKTRDVLLRHIRDVNQINRELQQYGHHVTLLSQVCNRLISIYTKDDTSGILRTNKELTGRYSALLSSCTARGKSLQAALQSLNQFDEEMAEFLAWMGVVEGALEQMETKDTKPNLKDVTAEIRERDGKFRLLSNRGREQLGHTGESDIVLSSKVEELNRRWTGLQNSILHLSDRVGRQSEASVQESSSLVAWIKTKREELDSLKLGRNLSEILKQTEEHRSFREKISLKEKENDKLRKTSMEIDKEWRALELRSLEWQKDLAEAEKCSRSVETVLKEADTRLTDLNASSGEWDLPPSLDTADAERDEVESTISGLHDVEELVLTAKLKSDEKPFLDVTDRLAAVEKRLTALKEAAVSRREQLSGLVVQQDPGNQEFLRDSVPEGWERCLTSEHIPYYSHHVDETTAWDHPEFVSLLESLATMNTVKYCAYRLALKLRKVQQKLCLDLLDIESIGVCFDAHGLAKDKNDLTIAVPEIVTILTSIYETLYQCEPEEINVPLCVDLCLNWILNVFDTQRSGLVRVQSFKIGLVLLCRGQLNEKYAVLFSQAAGSEDPSATLDQRRLGLLLYDCMQVPRYLGEIALFGGSNIEPSVRSCLQKSTNKAQSQVNLNQFLEWLKEEPQSLVWLPVLHRLASAETARHDVKCKICKVDPIVGFRYHCRKCFNLDICHACFFLGKTVKGHKPEHPMQEYCTSTNRTDNAKHLLQAFRNSFRSGKYFKKKQKKLGYLPVQSVLEGENFESPTMSPNLSFESREFPGSMTESLSSKLAMEMTESMESRAEDDEHSLIASYCRVLTATNNNHLSSTANILKDVDTRLDNMEKEEVEQILQQLQEENSRLEAEYEELLAAGKSGKTDTSQEEKTLKQQKTRLEARMAILEDHNRQLEAQLDRLRQLVSTEPLNGSTQTTRFVVAAELHEGEHAESPADGKRPPPTVRRRPPSALNLKAVHQVERRKSNRDSGTSGTTDQSNRTSGTSGSLNLSQHNTDSQVD